jgi:protein-L-isoaspartate(D-aspartate) O-methyltransferase
MNIKFKTKFSTILPFFSLIALGFLAILGNVSCIIVSEKKQIEPIDRFDQMRLKMVEYQIEARGIKDRRVLEAIRKVPRHLFVPENLQDIAYNDEPLPIGSGQTISQPYIVAYMTEILRLQEGDRVLEIGTGSGYQAAVLAELVDSVFTIEILPGLSKKAAQVLNDLKYENIFFKVGNGFYGWPEKAPFDAIIVTAAPEKIPQPLVDQLSLGGRMIIPVGDFFQELYLMRNTEAGIKKEKKLPVRFVPLQGEP